MLGQIRDLAQYFGRDIEILDIGGRPDYWLNLGFENIARVDLLNARRSDLDRALPEGVPEGIFTRQVGDARNLAGYADGSVDLVHSNSVIEHVGGWRDMQAMASDLRRVGRAGWVQTPAWSFPIEPHFHTPFMHWFAAPIRARMLSFSLGRRFRRMGLATRRERVDSINLLTRAEMAALFPGSDIDTERLLLLAKSYVARWMPDAGGGGGQGGGAVARGLVRKTAWKAFLPPCSGTRAEAVRRRAGPPTCVNRR